MTTHLDNFSDAEQIRQAWVKFNAAQSLQAYCQSWVELLCNRVRDIEHCVLVMQLGPSGFEPQASWPPKHSPDEELLALINEGIEEKTGLVHVFSGGRFGIAYPVKLDDEVVALMALAVRVSKDQLPSMMEQLQWSSAWIELVLRRQSGTLQKEQFDRVSMTLDVLAALISETGHGVARLTFVNELAAALDCDSVSLGQVKNGRMVVLARSHTAKLLQKMNLVRSLSTVMDEALLRRKVIVFPPEGDGENPALPDHSAYSESLGNICLLSIPIHIGDEFSGCVLFERGRDFPFDERDQRLAQSIVGLAGSALKNQELRDSPWYAHLWRAMSRQAGRLLGSGFIGRKLLAASAVLAVLFLVFAEGTYRISADSELQGTVLRAMTAPSDGYLESAAVKAGDSVKSGQVLAKLDATDLRLQRTVYASERAKYQRQYEEAVAARNHAEAKIDQALIEQSQARLRLVESQLGRTTLIAPFDGLVVSGDLSQRLGSAVRQGDVLFELSPPDDYTVLLWVDEHRVDDVRVGQRGQLILSSLPESTFGFVVTRVTPVTQDKDGANRFRVEAKLQSNGVRVQPGMKGVGKIEVDSRNLFWVWTHPLWQWIDLKLWAWVP